MKKISLYKISHFLESYTHSKNKIKVELDLSNYATKSDLKNGTGVDTSNFAKKSDLASLKSDVDKLHIDKLKSVPNGSDSLKSKAGKLDVGKLKLVPTDFKKMIMKLLRNICMTNWLKKSMLLRLMILII